MSKVKRFKSTKRASREKKLSTSSKRKIWTIILGAVMVFSVFGIVLSGFNSGNEEGRYGDYNMKRTQNGWSTDVFGQTVEFLYHPSDVDRLEMSPEVVQRLIDSKIVYITIDPNATDIQTIELARFYLLNTLSGSFDKVVMPGIISESAEYVQPLIDCQNATNMLPVIKIIQSNITKATLEDDCIILQARENAAAALATRLVYGEAGIITTETTINSEQ